MSEILKHSFDAVSLLTTSNGMLEVTIIPAIDQPDWILPSSLILDTEDCAQPTWTYSWQQQKLPVYHLFMQDQLPSKILVLEGNTTAHRIALQTSGTPHSLRVRISDVKDSTVESHANVVSDDDDKPVSSYLYQTVMIEDTVYLIPDIDKLAHHLIHN